MVVYVLVYFVCLVWKGGVCDMVWPLGCKVGTSGGKWEILKNLAFTEFRWATYRLSIECLHVRNLVGRTGIFTDCHNIFLWHESEDINQKSLFQNFSWFQFLHFQVMDDYHCSHRLLFWIKSHVRVFLWKLLSFHTEMISA